MQCPECGSTQVTYDHQSGSTVCGNYECGAVIDDRPIVEEISFQSDSFGGKSVQGQQIAYGSTTRCYGLVTSQQLAVENGIRNIRSIATALRLNGSVEDDAIRLFRLAQTRGFTKGRPVKHVAAGTLYVACRQKKSPHLLIDFSDALKSPIRNIGRIYAKLVRCLYYDPEHERIPILDPSMYLDRFAKRLTYGEKHRDIVQTASRVMAAMRREWMVTGRRPVGLCGAALLIASRYHSVETSPREMAKIVRIGEYTLKKRIYEFRRTSTAQLSRKEFEALDTSDVSQNRSGIPPCMMRSRQRDKEQLAQAKVLLNNSNYENAIKDTSNTTTWNLLDSSNSASDVLDKIDQHLAMGRKRNLEKIVNKIQPDMFTENIDNKGVILKSKSQNREQAHEEIVRRVVLEQYVEQNGKGDSEDILNRINNLQSNRSQDSFPFFGTTYSSSPTEESSLNKNHSNNEQESNIEDKTPILQNSPKGLLNADIIDSLEQFGNNLLPLKRPFEEDIYKSGSVEWYSNKGQKTSPSHMDSYNMNIKLDNDAYIRPMEYMIKNDNLNTMDESIDKETKSSEDFFSNYSELFGNEDENIGSFDFSNDDMYERYALTTSAELNKDISPNIGPSLPNKYEPSTVIIAPLAPAEYEYMICETMNALDRPQTYYSQRNWEVDEDLIENNLYSHGPYSIQGPIPELTKVDKSQNDIYKNPSNDGLFQQSSSSLQELFNDKDLFGSIDNKSISSYEVPETVRSTEQSYFSDDPDKNDDEMDFNSISMDSIKNFLLTPEETLVKTKIWDRTHQRYQREIDQRRVKHYNQIGDIDRVAQGRKTINPLPITSTGTEAIRAGLAQVVKDMDRVPLDQSILDNLFEPSEGMF